MKKNSKNLKVLSIYNLFENFKSGRIKREKFWLKMKDFHSGLKGYSKLLKENYNLEKIEISAEGLFIILKNGLKMIWNPEDIRAVPSMLINHGEYEFEELQLLKVLARKCEVIFDIGANAGWYSLNFAKFVKKKSVRIYTFEPIPGIFSILKKNIKLNDFSGMIHPFDVAFGEYSGIAKFYIPNFTGSVASSRTRLFPHQENKVVRCKMLRLDDFIKKQKLNLLDLIKCDVEGAELLVYQGGLKTITRFRPIIISEMLRKWSLKFHYHPNDIIKLLSGIGYKCFTVKDNRLVRFFEMNQNTVETNFFFLHSVKHASQIRSLIS